jgi:hypothetical protein
MNPSVSAETQDQLAAANKKQQQQQQVSFPHYSLRLWQQLQTNR